MSGLLLGVSPVERVVERSLVSVLVAAVEEAEELEEDEDEEKRYNLPHECTMSRAGGPRRCRRGASRWRGGRHARDGLAQREQGHRPARSGCAERVVAEERETAEIMKRCMVRDDIVEVGLRAQIWSM